MNNKGITLISLTMYVVGITFVIIAVATLTSFFYNNIVDLRDSTDSLSEFDKFNVAFLKEVKNDEVSVINIEKTKITFSNGVTFQFQDNGIYRNYVKICEQIKDCQFSSTTMGENIFIKVYLEIGTDFAKTLEYVGNHKQNNETNKRLILTKSTEEYTNGNVIVTLNYINLPEGYEIQYKIGDNQWTAGTSVTVEENNTVVYGRIYNNTTLDEKDNNSIIITNIDKEAPTAPTEIEYSSTINSITVRAIGGTDNLSGVAGYQYSIDNIHWTKTIEDGTNYIFSGLQLGTNYTIYVRTVDNVGTISINKTKTINELGIPIEILNDMDINLLTPEQKTINGHYLLRGNINIQDTSESKNGILTTLKDKILEIDNKSICSLNGGTYNGDIQLNEEASLNINEGANINGNILMQESSNLTVNSGTISKNIEGGNITITNGNINGNIVNAENLSINAGYYTGEIIDCKNIKITGGYFRNWPPDPVQGYFVIPSDNSGDYPYMVVKEEDQRCSVD